jgi:Tfp pilus assembly protein PilF
VRAKRAEDSAVESLARVAAERDEKEQARRDAQAVAGFLTEVFRSPDPSRSGRTITVAESLERAATKLDEDFKGQPDRRAHFQHVLGNTFHALGLYDEAIKLQQEAYNYQLSTRGEEDLRTLSAASDLALSYSLGGKPGYGARLQESLLQIHRRNFGAGNTKTLAVMQNLANSYEQIGRHGDAMNLRTEVLAQCRNTFGLEHPRTLSAMQNLAISKYAAGEKAEALALREEALEKFRVAKGPEDPDTLRAMNNLAISYEHAGRHGESLALRESLLKLGRKVFGPEHRETMLFMENLAGSYDHAGRRDEAMRLRGDAAELRMKALEKRSGQSLATMVEIATAFEQAGRQQEARTLRDDIGRRAEIELPASPGREHLGILQMRAEWRARQGRWQGAADDCARLVGLSPESIRHLHHAALLMRIKDRAAYEALARQALDAFGASVHDLDAERVSKICWLLPDLGIDLDKARALSDRALKLDGYSHSWALLNKGLCELRSGDLAVAAEFLEKAAASGLAPEGRATAQAALAMTRHRQGQPQAAAAALAAASEILSSTFAQPDDMPQQVPVGQWYDWLIARCLFEEAEALMK